MKSLWASLRKKPLWNLTGKVPLQNLIRKECDKRDRKYARLEDKYNKLEQHLTKKDPKNMPQRSQSSNNEGTGASKKNKFNKRPAANQPSTHPRSTPPPPSNPGQQNHRNSETPEQVAAKKLRFQAKKRKQTLVALSKQINSESTQYRWQEKTAKDTTTK